MSDSDIQLDDDIKLTSKSQDGTPSWMVALVVIPFLCLLAVAAMQFIEYRYYRGVGASESDPYAEPALIPPV